MCKKENNISKLELNIRSNGLYYRAEVTGDSMFDNIDLALPKVERQIVKYGDKIESKLKKGALKEKKFEFFDTISIFILHTPLVDFSTTFIISKIIYICKRILSIIHYLAT